MANNIDLNQLGRLEKYFKVSGLQRLFYNEETEWQAIVLLQNKLDGLNCSRYIYLLDKMNASLVTATIDQRIEALLEVIEQRKS